MHAAGTIAATSRSAVCAFASNDENIANNVTAPSSFLLNFIIISLYVVQAVQPSRFSFDPRDLVTLRPRLATGLPFIATGNDPGATGKAASLSIT
jgi:hypothetical protein